MCNILSPNTALFYEQNQLHISYYCKHVYVQGASKIPGQTLKLEECVQAQKKVYFIQQQIL
jgi:hypothetical protein